jgi:hypothetical protein
MSADGRIIAAAHIDDINHDAAATVGWIALILQAALL